MKSFPRSIAVGAVACAAVLFIAGTAEAQTTSNTSAAAGTVAGLPPAGAVVPPFDIDVDPVTASASTDTTAGGNRAGGMAEATVAGEIKAKGFASTVDPTFEPGTVQGLGIAGWSATYDVQGGVPGDPSTRVQVDLAIAIDGILAITTPAGLASVTAANVDYIVAVADDIPTGGDLPDPLPISIAFQGSAGLGGSGALGGAILTVDENNAGSGTPGFTAADLTDISADQRCADIGTGLTCYELIADVMLTDVAQGLDFGDTFDVAALLTAFSFGTAEAGMIAVSDFFGTGTAAVSCAGATCVLVPGQAVPEPVTIALLLTALGGLAARRSRRNP